MGSLEEVNSSTITTVNRAMRIPMCCKENGKNSTVYASYQNKMAKCVGKNQQQNGVIAQNHADINLVKTTLELTEFITNYIAGDKSLKPRSSYAVTMKRTVDEVLCNYKIVFNNMAKKLNINQDNLEETFVNVLDEMSNDNNIHWGRIVTVYAFAGILARHCVRSGMSDMVSVLKQRQNEYILHRFGCWMDREGGWDAFNENFPPPNQLENVVWTGLLVTAVGLGALATLVAAR